MNNSLQELNLPGRDTARESGRRFRDGAHYRIEIPSTEGPEAFKAVLEEAAALNCPVHRVSQGSGIQMLSDAEIREMARLGAEYNIEVCLFTTPRANFDTGGLWNAPAGRVAQWQVRGADQLQYSLDDIKRACDLGIRSVLLADYGLIDVVNELKQAGRLPVDLAIKSSAVLAPANPASARLLERIGSTTINLATDLSVSQLSAIRQAVEAPLDLYVEAPDGLGGFVRHHEAPDMIRFAAPVYIKLGLRNSPDIYPSGRHMEAAVLSLSRERVRRSRLVCDLIERTFPEAILSPTGIPHPDLAIPVAQ